MSQSISSRVVSRYYEIRPARKGNQGHAAVVIACTGTNRRVSSQYGAKRTHHDIWASCDDSPHFAVADRPLACAEPQLAAAASVDAHSQADYFPRLVSRGL